MIKIGNQSSEKSQVLSLVLNNFAADCTLPLADREFAGRNMQKPFFNPLKRTISLAFTKNVYSRANCDLYYTR